MFLTIWCVGKRLADGFLVCLRPFIKVVFGNFLFNKKFCKFFLAFVVCVRGQLSRGFLVVLFVEKRFANASRAFSWFPSSVFYAVMKVVFGKKI